VTELLPPDEAAIGNRIRVLADAATLPRDPRQVAGAVLAQSQHRPWWPIVAVASFGVLAVAVLVTVLTLGAPVPSGSRPATAQVDGVTYAVGFARSIDLSGAALTPYATATQDSGFPTESATAYQVDDVDPGRALVMRLVPGQSDDAGSIGRYLVLTRGDGYDLLCPYFRPGDPLAPTVCP
jgi:hypothetical protein